MSGRLARRMLYMTVDGTKQLVYQGKRPEPWIRNFSG